MSAADAAMDVVTTPWYAARRVWLRSRLGEPFVPAGGAASSSPAAVAPVGPAPRAVQGAGANPAHAVRASRAAGRSSVSVALAADASPQDRARAWLDSSSAQSRRSAWLPFAARADPSPFRRPSAIPVVLAASPAVGRSAPQSSEASSDSDAVAAADAAARATPFGWTRASAPMVPVIPTLLQHVPRPVKPAIDLGELMNHCIARGVISFVAGGVLGAGMGVLIGSWQVSGHTPEPGMSDPTKLTAREAFREMLVLIKTKSISWARNFAVVGSIYSTVECYLASARGRHDIKNPVFAGCITGGALAYNQGPVAILGGCAGFAAFSFVIEQFMHSSGGGNPFAMPPPEEESEAER